MQLGLGGSRSQVPQQPKPQSWNLVFGTQNLTSLGREEPELVPDVERYRLDVVEIASTYILGSETQSLKRGWTLLF